MKPDIDVNHRSSGGQTPLHIAVGLFLHGLAALLLVKGADPNARDQRGRTPLMNAAKVGDTRTQLSCSNMAPIPTSPRRDSAGQL